MRTHELMEFAAMLADQFPTVINGCRRLDERALQQYWVTSQARFNTWGAKLRRASDQLNATRYGGRKIWTAWSPMFDELMVSDATTRIWSSLLNGLDERLGLMEYSPIGRSVRRGHDTARERVINLVLKGKQAGSEVACRLEQIQLGTERWTDCLLAGASTDPATADCCYDSERFEHYASLGRAGKSRRLASYRIALNAALGRTSVIPTHINLHHRMHAQILACVGPEVRIAGTANHTNSTWQSRIVSLTDDAQAMIERWLDPDLLDPSQHSQPSSDT